MKFIQGHDRTQTHLFPVSLDQSIDPDNQARLIDLFVDSLPLDEFGFRTDFIDNGRPAYHPSDLLKLYIYERSNTQYSFNEVFKYFRIEVFTGSGIKNLRPENSFLTRFR